MRYFLSSWFRVLLKVSFECAFHSLFYAGAFLSFATLGSDFVHVGRRAIGRVGLFKPFRKQWLQFAHVLKAELKRFKSTNGSLTEHIAVQSAESQAHVRLSKAQLDASLFELFGEIFQIVSADGRVVFFGLRKV